MPKSGSDIATFDVSNLTAIPYSRSTEVGGFVFNPGASSYTFTVPVGDTTLTVSGEGIINNSGNPQQFVVAGGRKSFRGGILLFARSATAGDATYTLNAGGLGEFAFGALMNFLDSSTAGSGTFIVQGSTDDAILSFFDDSDGGTARIELAGGRVLATSHSLATLTIGSLEGNGAFTHAPGETAIGSNNLSTIFAGVISSPNGRPGPITKIGTGRLTLTGANTYTGGTIVNQGTFLVDNTSGSGTGTGDVTVNTGTLGGDGAIAGAVTVGTGSGPARISPGAKGKNDTGLLTIQSVLTFGSQGSYQFQLDSDRSTVDTLSANGVTIGSGTLFQANDLGGSVLPPGTIFLVVDNTATTPIAGAFDNLAEGAIVTVNGNNLQASYEGGDGNDLTLTVVP